MSYLRNPPCVKGCPDRDGECHARCEKYRMWRMARDRLSEEQYELKKAGRSVYEMGLERKDWLRRKGYKTHGGGAN